MAKIVEVSRCPYPNPISVIHTADMENGQIVGIGKVEKIRNSQVEVYKVENPKLGEPFAIVVGDTLQYDEANTDFDYVAKANVPVRAYMPKAGDVFTIEKTIVKSDSSANVGDYLKLVLDGSHQLEKATNKADGGVARIRRKRKYNGQDSIEIEFI